ncbi:MAG TPA: isocitrate/isopropylmalate family dehydrogenase [Phycisphaerales bacterium]|nr:isocitrate/isopropylmalate family dehydrogenase [Phycisphaerales bacterium]
MPQLRIALAPGDGIGPEIMQATLELFRAAGVAEHAEFVPVEMGAAVFATGNLRGMTDEAIAGVEAAGVLFKGPFETPKGGGGKSVNVTARKLWSTFANFRQFITLPGVSTIYSRAGVRVDLCIVRENLEDTYAGIEHRLSADVFQCKRLTTAPGCDQVCRFAFETARRLGLATVHCGHKANIMKMTDGLFLERFRAAAADFPEIAPKDVIVDALCMNLVLRPQQYQMLVLPNLQGDIVSDLAAGLVGGLGFAPSANIGRHISIFEAVHGTAPDIAGRGIANPTALMLSGLMLLRHVGLVRQAALIHNALLAALEAGARTGDFGDAGAPVLTTAEFTRAIIDRLGAVPTTVAPQPVPAPDAPQPLLPPPQRPGGQTLIRALAPRAVEVAGCDVYLAATRPPGELAAELARACEGLPLALTLISNRGTQVWPTGSIYTECVDYFRARFEARVSPAGGPAHPGPTQDHVMALAGRLAAGHALSAVEVLRTFDGMPGYSRAQGQ